jgi:hypothetical protein
MYSIIMFGTKKKSRDQIALEEKAAKARHFYHTRPKQQSSRYQFSRHSSGSGRSGFSSAPTKSYIMRTASNASRMASSAMQGNAFARRMTPGLGFALAHDMSMYRRDKGVSRNKFKRSPTHNKIYKEVAKSIPGLILRRYGIDK